MKKMLFINPPTKEQVDFGGKEAVIGRTIKSAKEQPLDGYLVGYRIPHPEQSFARIHINAKV